jgi:tetratricopeptide (TPR) repeat protein
MRVRVDRVALLTAASLFWLTGCETTSPKIPDFFSAITAKDKAENPPEPNETGSTTAALPPGAPPPAADPSPPGAQPEVLPREYMPSDPNDDRSLGKQNFRQGNYGLAERYFRRAVESGPRDAESWLGLAASYDRLRRFDLADRAYAELIKMLGPTPEVLNNQGYSYMLRGNYARARELLLAAQAKDPSNPYIRNNLDLLEASVRARSAVR